MRGIGGVEGAVSEELLLRPGEENRGVRIGCLRFHSPQIAFFRWKRVLEPQFYFYAADRVGRATGTARLVRACEGSEGGGGGQDFHAGRGLRRPLDGAEFVYGRDERDREYSEQRDRAEPDNSRRNRARHEHTRRRQHRVGGCRVRSHQAAGEDDVCDALLRTDRAR